MADLIMGYNILTQDSSINNSPFTLNPNNHRILLDPHFTLSAFYHICTLPHLHFTTSSFYYMRILSIRILQYLHFTNIRILLNLHFTQSAFTPTAFYPIRILPYLHFTLSAVYLIRILPDPHFTESTVYQIHILPNPKPHARFCRFPF